MNHDLDWLWEEHPGKTQSLSGVDGAEHEFHKGVSCFCQLFTPCIDFFREHNTVCTHQGETIQTQHCSRLFQLSVLSVPRGSFTAHGSAPQLIFTLPTPGTIRGKMVFPPADSVNAHIWTLISLDYCFRSRLNLPHLCTWSVWWGASPSTNRVKAGNTHSHLLYKINCEITNANHPLTLSLSFSLSHT